MSKDEQDQELNEAMKAENPNRFAELGRIMAEDIMARYDRNRREFFMPVLIEVSK